MPQDDEPQEKVEMTTTRKGRRIVKRSYVESDNDEMEMTTTPKGRRIVKRSYVQSDDDDGPRTKFDDGPPIASARPYSETDGGGPYAYPHRKTNLVDCFRALLEAGRQATSAQSHSASDEPERYPRRKTNNLEGLITSGDTQKPPSSMRRDTSSDRPQLKAIGPPTWLQRHQARRTQLDDQDDVESEEEPDNGLDALRQQQRFRFATSPESEETTSPPHPASRVGGRSKSDSADSDSDDSGSDNLVHAPPRVVQLASSLPSHTGSPALSTVGDSLYADEDPPDEATSFRDASLENPDPLGDAALADDALLADPVGDTVPADPNRLGDASLPDTNPRGMNQSVTFNEIGGLDDHIHTLKDITLLPLMYPEVFQQFRITPPRGIIFHGPSGTGKTLMAQALATFCRTNGRQITFYMRKDVDLLSKGVGEAERQLRLLFQEARAHQPSIIFFDEIDALVRSCGEDQIHASFLATFLALMDDLDGRSVIVIGATNRPDALRPTMRGPGRFDREFYFGLPNTEARERILTIMTRGWTGWDEESAGRVNVLAALTEGYSGADLKALCTEAALNAVQRHYPQIYETTERLALNRDTMEVELQDFKVSVKSEHPAHKRRRATSSGDAVVTQTVYSTRGKSIAAESRDYAAPGDVIPVQWRQIFDKASAVGGSVPPPAVVQKLVEIREDCLRDFRSAQESVQEATKTNECFTQSSSAGSIPDSVSGALKLPPVQIMKAAAGIELDPAVMEAKAAAEKEIASAAVASTKYLAALYGAQVTTIRKRVHVPSVAEAFAASIKTYGDSVIKQGLGRDCTIWDPVFTRLKVALVCELEMLGFEFVARIARDAEVKEAEAAAVSTAPVDAETTNSARSVDELIEEKIGALYQKLENNITMKFLKAARKSTKSIQKSKANDRSSSNDTAGGEPSAKAKGKKRKHKPSRREDSDSE
ncbi:hypothetical protein B0H12DRAFT_241526 [Mycena haematopus]|nr:hypothetical protein B0H12DRAFT_241526 [Mycena haematopus]